MRTAPMSIGLSMALACGGVVHAKTVPQCLGFAQPPTPALVLAAAQGNAVAESRLGTDYAHGIAAPKDIARAAAADGRCAPRLRARAVPVGLR